MKWLWLVSVAMLALAGPAVWAAEMAGPSPAVAVNQPAVANGPSPAATSASPATDKLTGCINDMRKATAPGEIVAAHQRCEVLTPVSLRLDVTFVERMVARGEPEGALEAAKRVLIQEPNNGLARGVVAYNEARAEEWPAALGDVIQANLDRPHDPLIERTAGSVLAWLDNAADQSTMPAELGPKVDFLRQTACESAGAKAVYRSAAVDYRRMAASTYAVTYGATFADDPRPAVVQVPFRVPTGPVIWSSDPRKSNYWFTFPNGLDLRKTASLWWFPSEAVVNGNGVVRSAPSPFYQWPTTSGYNLPPPPVGIGP
jgi:hypothetical protein